jgi:hypothetical protein
LSISGRGVRDLVDVLASVTLGDALDRLEAGFGGSTECAPTMSVLNMLIEENT